MASATKHVHRKTHGNPYHEPAQSGEREENDASRERTRCLVAMAYVAAIGGVGQIEIQLVQGASPVTQVLNATLTLGTAQNGA